MSKTNQKNPMTDGPKSRELREDFRVMAGEPFCQLVQPIIRNGYRGRLLKKSSSLDCLAELVLDRPRRTGDRLNVWNESWFACSFSAKADSMASNNLFVGIGSRFAGEPAEIRRAKGLHPRQSTHDGRAAEGRDRPYKRSRSVRSGRIGTIA